MTFKKPCLKEIKSEACWNMFSLHGQQNSPSWAHHL